MAFDPNFLLILAGSILFLAFLVWLMVRSATKPEWQKISAGARAERKNMEKKSP